MATYQLNVNGKTHSVEVDPATPILWVLRDHLNLVGTKFGCGIAQCGACTIHVDGSATRSCMIPVSSIGNSKVTTIEGLSEKGDHPVQKAWLEHDVYQCGYCQAGQIVACHSLIAQQNMSNNNEVADQMTNLCRCGTYPRIRKAVQDVISRLDEEE